MGEQLVLLWVPWNRRSADEKAAHAELMQRYDALCDDEVNNALQFLAVDTAEELRQRVSQNIQFALTCEAHRQVERIYFAQNIQVGEHGVWEYSYLITGGLTWGDSPTSAWGELEILSYLLLGERPF